MPPRNHGKQPPSPPLAAAGGLRNFWSHAAGRACTVKKTATPPPLPGALGYFGCIPLGELCAVKIPSPLSPAAAGGFRKFWLHAAGRACTVKTQAFLYNPQGVGLLAARAAIRNFVPAGRQNRKEDDRLPAARTARGKKKWLGLYTRGRGKKLPGVFSLQLSWVSSCEVHKTTRMTRVPIPTQLGYFKQAAGLFFCCSRKRASRSRSRESDCAARRPARCGRCELRCEVRCELRCELRCRFRCQFRCELRAM